MSKYFTQFGEDGQVIGTNLTGWTVRNGAPSRKPAYGTPAVQRRFLELYDVAGTGGAVSWDRIDTDAGRQDVDIVTAFSNDALQATDGYIFARGTAYTDWYRLNINVSGSIVIAKSVASVITPNIGSASVTFSAGKHYAVRFRVNGTSLKVRVWDFSALGMAKEPSSWNIDITDASLAGDGWVGLMSYHASVANQRFPWNFLAVGTNGDSAVCPRTNAEFLALLGKPAKRKIVAILSATGYDSGASPYTKTVKYYISKGGFDSQEQDTPSRKHFESVIQSLPTFSRQMNAALVGPASIAFGDLVLKNPSGRPTHEDFVAKEVGPTSIAASSSASLNFGTGSFSVFLRGRFDGFANPNSFPSFGKQGTTWNGTAGWGVGATYSATSVYVFFHDGTNFVSGYIALDPGFRPTDLVGQWCEIVFVADRVANTARIIVNGVLQSGSVSLAALTGSVSNGSTFTVGNTVGWLHDGYVDEVRAWSRALTLTDAVSIYKRRGDDVSANLALLWPCNEGTGTSIADKSGNGNTGTAGSSVWLTGRRTLVGNEDAPGRLDNLLRMSWNRSTVQLLIGGEDWPLHDFRPLLVGRLGQPTAPTVDSIRFELGDMTDALNAPIQTAKFSTGDFINKWKPRLFGDVRCLELQFDTTSLVAHINSAALSYSPSDANFRMFDCTPTAFVHIGGTKDCGVSSVNTTTETITTTVDHLLSAGYRIQFVGSGTPPAPLNNLQDYWVLAAGLTARDFRVTDTFGSTTPVNLTDAGSGQRKFHSYGYTFDVSAGTVSVVNPPAGRVFLFHPGADPTNHTVTSVIDAVAFGAAGLSSNHKDANSFSAANTLDVSQLMYTGFATHVDQNPTARAVLDELTEKCRAWYGFSFDGLLQTGAIAAASATAVKSFGTANVKSLSQPTVTRAVDFSVVQRFAQPWFSVGAQPIVPGVRYTVSGYDYGQTSAELSQGEVTIVPATYAAGIPLDDQPSYRDTLKIGDFHTMVTYAGSLDARWKDFFKRGLAFSQFNSTIEALWHANGPLSIGDTISLEHPRLGFKQYSAADPASPDNTGDIDARKAVVMGIDVNLSAPVGEQVKLKVYRHIVGYYPTADVN